MICIKVNIEGTEYRVPDGDILHLKKTLGVTASEAAKIWLEDEGKLHNAEQEALCKKAKESGVMRTIHGATSQQQVEKRLNKPKSEKPKTTKPAPQKEKIIADIAELLKGFCDNVEVTNPTKLIEFSYNGNNFKLDLVQKRGAKNSG